MKSRKIKFILKFTIIVFVILLWGSYTFVTIRSNDKTYCSTEVPFNETALLLGTSKYMDNGKVNQFFTKRCIAAEELWKREKLKKGSTTILVGIGQVPHEKTGLHF